MSEVTAQQLQAAILRSFAETATMHDRDADQHARKYAETDDAAHKVNYLLSKSKADQWREATRSAANCLGNLQQIQRDKP